MSAGELVGTSYLMINRSQCSYFKCFALTLVHSERPTEHWEFNYRSYGALHHHGSTSPPVTHDPVAKLPENRLMLCHGLDEDHQNTSDIHVLQVEDPWPEPEEATEPPVLMEPVLILDNQLTSHEESILPMLTCDSNLNLKDSIDKRPIASVPPTQC